MYFIGIINVLINRRNIKEKVKRNKKRFIKYKSIEWLRNIEIYIENK